MLFSNISDLQKKKPQHSVEFALQKSKSTLTFYKQWKQCLSWEHQTLGECQRARMTEWTTSNGGESLFAVIQYRRSLTGGTDRKIVESPSGTEPVSSQVRCGTLTKWVTVIPKTLPVYTTGPFDIYPIMKTISFWSPYNFVWINVLDQATGLCADRYVK